ncbi:T9SS type A sorting domain-containing protein [Thalassobellus suaedae]|uniref:T9SS type A sorting domain-containing protein n=1 Tax=Thalassobellus suaedae TaxID=3074124 RepID=UPI0039F50DDD
MYVSNVKSSTDINIYSITGALVKSLKTNKDTNFEFKSGLWIATVKTEEGQKSVKLFTR